ncbi:PKD domain-containing protein [Bacteroidales bacterium AH-315-I05]|nr:PKD domain-containing protein [Bacteroidales bacterium AH-315-I05]
MNFQKFYVGVILTVVFHLPLAAQLPIAEFTSDIVAGCDVITVNFTDLSTGSPTSWEWDFGNGNTSTSQDPSTSYINPGTYTVKLIATNGNGSDTIVKTNLITIHESPTSNFLTDITDGCTLSVTGSDASTAGSAPIVSWLWDWGEGNASTLQNPSYTYSAGAYNISLTVWDTNGCNDGSVILNNQLFDIPQVSFSAFPNNGCFTPHTVSFSDLTQPGSSGISSWLWNFGDGNTSTLQNPANTYNFAGSFNVTLSVTDSNICSDTNTFSQPIIIVGFNANFTGDVTVFCPNDPIQFSDLSSPTPTNWLWNFGDGFSSSLQNPIHSYAGAGPYTVTLIASDTITGCVDTMIKVDYISLLTPPTGDFTVDDNGSCVIPFTVNFTSTSSDSTILLWDFGNGNTDTVPNPSTTYTAYGDYTVSLTITDTNTSCTLTVIKPGFIKVQLPIAFFVSDVQEGCMPLTVGFSDASTSPDSIVAWEWNFGDSSSIDTNQNPTHIYLDSGVYDVTLKITTADGCEDSITIGGYIKVGLPPVIDFYPKDTAGCFPLFIGFTNLSSHGNSWEWLFGDGNGSVFQNASNTYSDNIGYFDVTLTVNHFSCPSTLVVDSAIQVLAPMALFNYDPEFGCDTPLTVNFTDSSVLADTWEWDFGDTTLVSNLQNPSHIYTSHGVFTVQLVVTNTTSGCTDTIRKKVFISNIISGFEQDTTQGCKPTSILFTDTSSGNFPIIGWNWDFGNGDSSLNNASFVTYTDSGIYDVKLIVTDSLGCQDSILMTDFITIYELPVAEFTAVPTFGCVPLTVSFFDASSSIAEIINWEWDYGDTSAVDSNQNPTHIYTVRDFYDVQLTITDSNNCKNSMSKQLYINPTFPYPNFSFKNPLCALEILNINNLSTGAGLTYFWDLGDGNTDTDINPTHVYDTAGIYTISLTATDSNGCDSNYSQIITVVPFPTANFGLDTFYTDCPPLVVTFADSSTADVVSWDWQFGDLATSIVQNPIHTYSYPDTFNVTLMVTDSVGCKDTIIKYDLIKVGGPYGIFDFTPKIGCVPTTVNFTSTTYNDIKILWDFGDGNVDSLSGYSPSHTYTSPGTYTPALIMTDTTGCVRKADAPYPDSIIVDDPISIITQLADSFLITLCNLDTVYFIDSSYTQNDNTTINSWNWNFGDGTGSTLQNPWHIYTDSGTYIITLEITNSLGGCKDTITDTIFVEVNDTAILKANAAVLQDVSCKDGNDGSALATGIQGTTPYTYLWSVSASSQTDSVAINLIAGTHKVTITDNNGCTDTGSVIITEPDSLIAAIIDIKNVSCAAGSDGEATASAIDGTTPYVFLWDIAANSQTTTLATGLSTGIYFITVTDTLGCTSTIFATVLEPLPLTTIIDTIRALCYGNCDGMGIAIPGGGTQPYSYQWDTATGLQVTDTAFGLCIGDYHVTITDSLGCTLADSAVITQPPILSTATTVNNVTCFGFCNGTATAIPTGGTPPYGFTWNNGDTLILTDSLCSGAYSVSVTDDNGCFTQDSNTIFQPDTLIIFTSSFPSSCENFDGTAVFDSLSGGTQPFTLLWDSAAFSQTDSSVTGLLDGTYTLTITDSNSCSSAISVIVATIPAPTSVTDSTPVSCNGGQNGTVTVIPAGGTPPYIYLWDTLAFSQTDSIVSGLLAGIYIVTVTDTINCYVIDTIEVTEPPQLTTSTNSDSATCFGYCDGVAVIVSSGGGPPYIYQWDSTINSQPSDTMTGLCAGIYYVTVTDTNNCAAIDSTVIGHPDSLVADSFALFNVTCKDSCDGSIMLFPAGGIVPYSYLWLTPSDTGQGTTSVDSLCIGNYFVTITDNNGCSTDTSFIITEPLALILSTVDIPVTCFGYNDGMSVATPSGGTPPYSYLWSDGQTDSIATSFITDTFFVVVTDTNNCIDTAQIIITSPTVVTVAPTVVPDTICYMQSTTLNANATGGNGSPYSYVWNGTDTVQSFSKTLLSSTSYYVVALDFNNCLSDTQTVDVFVHPPITIAPLIDDTICENDSANISTSASGGFGGTFTYNWNNGDTGIYITVKPASYPDSTVYEVIVSDGCSPDDTSWVTISYYTTPAPFFIADDTYDCEPHIVNFTNKTKDSIVDCLWNFGDGNTDSTCSNVGHPYLYSGSYDVSLSVISIDDCPASYTINNFIVVNNLPVASFTAIPTTADMSNPIIQFEDQSLGAVIWSWGFGDGDVSDETSPSHTYQDTGTYNVILFITNQYDCSGQYEIPVRIEPYYDIKVPNAFIPSPSGPNGGYYDYNSFNNEVFIPITAYITDFHMQIFNRWGEMIFESNDLKVGWDGYYRDKLSQQDSYVYVINVMFLDGTPATKKGTVTLIR